ncbi:DUF4433 domain-containing protein [Bacillus sp. Marseille-Q3570]|uniref:DUF4433 domain-containing protein n=1 Tax=Bacillus sp. Marseille-Q3570 TaxID=2963522 RepID=UPI0021B817C5|nr:DUF4433 domain-containing protein [Bacillus sp. Marseille-Q3570]
MERSVTQRGIKYLVHFTRVDNLESIFTNGLIPVETLRRERFTNFFHNDEYRMDDCETANCLSIQFPNYRMFFKYRQQNPTVDWVVLGIKKEVLWKKDCAFCKENAASSNVLGIPLELRKGVGAFNGLYDEYPGKPSRSTLDIDPALPTHPQAEILVFDVIEPENIWGVAFENLYEKNKYSSLLPSNINCEVVGRLFSYRKDYEYWR